MNESDKRFRVFSHETAEVDFRAIIGEKYSTVKFVREGDRIIWGPTNLRHDDLAREADLSHEDAGMVAAIDRPPMLNFGGYSQTLGTETEAPERDETIRVAKEIFKGTGIMINKI